MAMLEVKDLHVYYGVIQALKGISFEVNQGEVIALTENLSEVQYGQLLADTANQLHIMLDQQDRHVKMVSYKANGIHQLLCLIGVHTCCKRFQKPYC